MGEGRPADLHVWALTMQGRDPVKLRVDTTRLQNPRDRPTGPREHADPKADRRLHYRPADPWVTTHVGRAGPGRASKQPGQDSAGQGRAGRGSAVARSREESYFLSVVAAAVVVVHGEVGQARQGR